MRLNVRKGWFVGLGILIVVLIGLRAAAPFAVQRYVNRVLDRAEGYNGRIGDVDLALIRGAYQIEDVEILKSDGKVPVPLFKSPLVDLSIEWPHDFQHADHIAFLPILLRAAAVGMVMAAQTTFLHVARRVVE